MNVSVTYISSDYRTVESFDPLENREKPFVVSPVLDRQMPKPIGTIREIGLYRQKSMKRAKRGAQIQRSVPEAGS